MNTPQDGSISACVGARIGRSFVLIVMALVLIAGIAKAIDVAEFSRALGTWSMLPRSSIAPLAVAIPAIEVFLAASWFLGFHSIKMAIAAILLGLIVTVVYVAHLILGEEPNCGCIGVLERYVNWRSTAWDVVFRNGLLASLGVLGLALASRDPSPPAVGRVTVAANCKSWAVICWAAISALALCQSAIAQPPSDIVGSRVGISLPAPLTQDDAIRYTSLLQLSDEQTAAWSAMCSKHKQFTDSFRIERLEPLKRRSGDVAQLDGPEHFLALGTLLDDRNRAAADLASAERLLFDELSALLAPAQVRKLDFVRLDRKRVLHQRAFEDNFLPECRQDLVSHLLDLNLLDVTDAEMIEAMVAYLEEVVPVVEVIDDRMARVAIKSARLLAEYIALQEQRTPGWERPAQILLEQRSDVLRSLLQPSQRLARLNRMYLSRFSFVVASEDAQRLMNAYLTSSYSELYPDSEFCGPFFSACLALKDLDDAQRPAVEAMQEQFEQRYDLLAKRLHKAIEEWKGEANTSAGFHVTERKAYEDGLLDGKEKRSLLNQTARKQVLAILTPEQAAALNR